VQKRFCKVSNFDQFPAIAADLPIGGRRLNGIVTVQQEDLRKLSITNKNIKRRIRHAVIAASVIVAVGLTTWLSGAHALFLATQ
jgi:hypothetical protein